MKGAAREPVALLPNPAARTAVLLGAGARLAEQITPGVRLAVKSRYLREYTEAAVFSGRAPYVGPALYARITVASRAAWDYRIPREATAPQGTLDLTNFERHQAKLQSRFEFWA